MKSELGTFSLLTVTLGYFRLKDFVTLSRPSISLWLVNVCQYVTVPVNVLGLLAAVGALPGVGAFEDDTPGGATACGEHAAIRSPVPVKTESLRKSRLRIDVLLNL
jgi:hypothetical protein